MELHYKRNSIDFCIFLKKSVRFTIFIFLPLTGKIPSPQHASVGWGTHGPHWLALSQTNPAPQSTGRPMGRPSTHCCTNEGPTHQVPPLPAHSQPRTTPLRVSRSKSTCWSSSLLKFFIFFKENKCTCNKDAPAVKRTLIVWMRRLSEPHFFAKVIGGRCETLWAFIAPCKSK